MRDINEVFLRFIELHGTDTPTWDRDRLHKWLASREPEWMHLGAAELDDLLGIAHDAEVAEAAKE
jgi:hypothetical protein